MLTATERAFAGAVNQIIHSNPFAREEIARFDQAALEVKLPVQAEELGGQAAPVKDRPKLSAIVRRAEGVCELVRRRLVQGKSLEEHDSALYRDLVLFTLYFRFRFDLQKTIETSVRGADSPRGQSPRQIDYYDRFAEEAERFLGSTGWLAMPSYHVAHRFALCFQIRRAFHFIDAKIHGRSQAIDRLRAAVWQSIFTHDMRRYDQYLHDKMHEITTLITGPSGTGKELVAEAIGQSRYIRFNAKKKEFVDDVGGAFHPVNLSAIPPSLIEAELFGHRKGAYTNAFEDRVGLLGTCGSHHSVFLDEIGELSETIQVKLLRVLQSGEYQRVGETEIKHFEGKVIAATNRKLGEEIRTGRFRRDFFYRLCSDQIATPSLHEQLGDNADELAWLVRILATRHFGAAGESVAEEVIEWIDTNLPKNYAWPGNIRELEQCIRSVLVRKEYRTSSEFAAMPPDQFSARLKNLQWTADELVSWYCTVVFSETGSCAETARRLNLDCRTVKRKIDNKWLNFE